MRQIIVVAVSCVAVLAWGAEPASDVTIVENDFVRLVAGADGHLFEFVAKPEGTDYLLRAEATPLTSIMKGEKAVPLTGFTLADGKLTVSFDGARAVLGIEVHPAWFTLEVLEVEGEDIDTLTICDVPLTLQGQLDDPFAACALALNLKTNVADTPGPMARLKATCHARFGLEGAKVAVIACPTAQLRDVMKEVVRSAPELPQSDIGGPFALDAAISRGSYLFDFGDVTEETVDQWVDFVKSIGMNQIDFHTGTSLRFGDCHPNPKLFPNGRASVKAVIDKLHAGGIAAGLHTYAFFIAKDTPYVTPVPDPRLGKDATFTLTTDLALDAAAVPVDETTEKMSTITGFFVRNSVTLQIDDELITYAAIDKEPPYAFTQCTRGAYGTKAAAHAKGAKVHHLKECFGLFTPDADSTLLAEVAKNTADTYNECGFDMIYLDALDGEDILGGHENSWHYGSKFVFEIANRLNKPALFEMSTFHHHLWYVRARMGAWDHPARSHKRFIDIHNQANLDGARMFLPMNLGWWAVKTWQEGASVAQTEPTFTDDIEYLLCKCLGTNSGFALMGVNPGNIGGIPAYQRLAPIFRQYEELRHAGYFPESILARLREPKKDFTLEKASDGAWRFRPAVYDRHKVQGLDGWSNAWTAKNAFGEQPLRVRIQALMSAEPYDSPNGVVVEDFANPDVLSDRAAAPGITASLAASTEQVKAGASSGRFTATNSGDKAVGAWAKIGKVYEPELNIGGQQALGVWVHGDGQGELLNVQLRSPEHTTNTGIGDHYVTVDFTGWRYFELIEMEGGRIEDYSWPYGGYYAVYRENVDYGQVHSMSFWFNNVPAGKEVACHLSPVRAVPLVKCAITNPRLSVAGKTIAFPVTMESGQYLELLGPDDCRLYGPKGELVQEVKLDGDLPVLAAGDNEVAFECDAADGPNPRAWVTVITRGEPLTP